MIEKPLFVCSSHRFKLAVEDKLRDPDDIIESICNIVVRLRNLIFLVQL